MTRERREEGERKKRYAGRSPSQAGDLKRDVEFLGFFCTFLEMNENFSPMVLIL
jgi:hypothetical protein